MIELLLGNKTAWKILRLLAGAKGKSVSKQEIRKILGIGKKTSEEITERLTKCGVIEKKKIGKTNFYKFNLANEFSQKIISLLEYEKHALYNLPESIISRVNDFIIKFFEILKPEKIILFGSYAKHVFAKGSDIDLAIITEKKIELKQKLQINKIIQKFENKGFKFQLHYFEKKEFDKLAKSEGIAKEIVKDGIIFFGL